jgi:hypothetical protein
VAFCLPFFPFFAPAVFINFSIGMGWLLTDFFFMGYLLIVERGL